MKFGFLFQNERSREARGGRGGAGRARTATARNNVRLSSIKE